MYRREFYQVVECLSKTVISVETCLLLLQQCLLGTALSPKLFVSTWAVLTSVTLIVSVTYGFIHLHPRIIKFWKIKTKKRFGEKRNSRHTERQTERQRNIQADGETNIEAERDIKRD
jgi:hypothetical protein